MKIQIELRPVVVTVPLVRPANHSKKYKDRYSVYTQCDEGLLLWSTSNDFTSAGRGVTNAHNSHSDELVSIVVLFEKNTPMALSVKYHEPK